MNIAMDLLRGVSTQDEDSDTTTATDKNLIELAANSWAELRASRAKFVEQETKPTTPQPTASELAKKMDAVATDLAMMSVYQVQPQTIPGMQPAAFDRLEQRMNGMDAKMDKIMQTLENLEAARVQAEEWKMEGIRRDANKRGRHKSAAKIQAQYRARIASPSSTIITWCQIGNNHPQSDY
jgi:hypothetical protein